jgi:hypothetical protein
LTVKKPTVPRIALVEAIACVALIVLAFAAIAASDVSPTGTHVYWVVLVVLFGLANFAADRLHTSHSLTDLRSGSAILLHWVGVYAALQMIYFFVNSGRIANADTGLSNGLILALGIFTAGAHGSWRLMVVGVALGAATGAVAFVEEYMWVLFGISVLALVVLLVGTRLAANWHNRATDEL